MLRTRWMYGGFKHVMHRLALASSFSFWKVDGYNSTSARLHFTREPGGTSQGHPPWRGEAITTTPAAAKFSPFKYIGHDDLVGGGSKPSKFSFLSPPRARRFSSAGESASEFDALAVLRANDDSACSYRGLDLPDLRRYLVPIHVVIHLTPKMNQNADGRLYLS
jgi:hypothetical protein